MSEESAAEWCERNEEILQLLEVQRRANMEDVEFLECQEEMNEQVLEQYTLVERVIGRMVALEYQHVLLSLSLSLPFQLHELVMVNHSRSTFASGGDSPTLNRTALREPIVFWNRLTAFCAGTRQKLFLARVQRFTVREGGEGVDNVELGRARPPRCARRAKGPLSVSLMLSRPVTEGMKWSLIASSSGWRSDDMSGPLVLGGGGKLPSSAPGPLVFLGNVRLPSLSGGTSPGYLVDTSDCPLRCPFFPAVPSE